MEGGDLAWKLNISDENVEKTKQNFVIISIITGISNFIGALLIFNCPFSAIGSYKWHLLNILICGFLMDLHIALIFMPYSLLPLAGVCTLGWPAPAGRFIGVHAQFAIFMELFGMYGLSLVIAILYHMSKILGTKSILKSKRGVIYGVLLQFGYSVPIWIAYLMLIPEDSQMLKFVASRVPPQTEAYIRSHSCGILIPSTSVYLFIALSTFMGIICSTAAFLCCGLAILLLLRNRASKNSAEYLKFKVMTIGLIAQLTIPWLAILIPISWVSIKIWVVRDNPADFTSLIFQIMACHSTINVIVMIIFTTPLRKTFPKIFPAENSVQNNNSHELFERRQTPAGATGRARSANHR